MGVDTCYPVLRLSGVPPPKMGPRPAEMGFLADEPDPCRLLPFSLPGLQTASRGLQPGCEPADASSSTSGRTGRTTPTDEQETAMTETIDQFTADRALKAKHRAMWALGDYPAVAIDVIPELGPELRRRRRRPRRRPGPRHRRRHRQRRRPRRPDRRPRDRLGPDPRAIRRRQRVRRPPRRRHRLGGGRRRSPALPRRQLRRRALLRRDNVRPAPPGRPPTSWSAWRAPAAGSGC